MLEPLTLKTMPYIHFFFNFTSMTWLKASAKLHIIMYIYILSSLSQGFLVHSICVRRPWRIRKPCRLAKMIDLSMYGSTSTTIIYYYMNTIVSFENYDQVLLY